jgi:hypothetical protein
MMSENCAICGCPVHRSGKYATPTVEGRSHATKHHCVAERFFGRSRNRSGTQREPIFASCPWGEEKKTTVFCYECHEELLHNPVLLPADILALAQLVKARNLNEERKAEDREKIAGRIRLFHEVIAAGLKQIAEQSCVPESSRS